MTLFPTRGCQILMTARTEAVKLSLDFFARLQSPDFSFLHTRHHQSVTMAGAIPSTCLLTAKRKLGLTFLLPSTLRGSPFLPLLTCLPGTTLLSSGTGNTGRSLRKFVLTTRIQCASLLKTLRRVRERLFRRSAQPSRRQLSSALERPTFRLPTGTAVGPILTSTATKRSLVLFLLPKRIKTRELTTRIPCQWTMAFLSHGLLPRLLQLVGSFIIGRTSPSLLTCRQDLTP